MHMVNEREAGKMAREENGKTPAMPHAFSLCERTRAEISGVRQVLTFDENEVALLTDAGELLLTGEGLHVTHLMQEEGKLSVEGKVDGVNYADRPRRRGLFRKA